MLKKAHANSISGRGVKTETIGRRVREESRRSVRTTVSAGAWTVSCANGPPENCQRSYPDFRTFVDLTGSHWKVPIQVVFCANAVWVV